MFRLALVSMTCLAILTASHSSEAMAAPAYDARACSARLHAALKPLADVHLPAMRAARQIATEGDERLPGRPMFPPDGSNRNRDATAALRASASLMRGQGRANWASSADNRWIVDRIVSDVTEFLSQSPAPYLCGGTDAYVEGLRAYLDRVSSAGGRSYPELVAVQAEMTRDSMTVALASTRPVPLPRWAPERFLPEDMPTSLLRPAYDLLSLPPGLDPIVTRTLSTSAYGPQIDPDLPPKRATLIPLETPADRLAAIAAILEAAGGQGIYDPSLSDAEDATLVAVRPVLGRLQTLKAAFSGRGILAGDRRTVMAIRRAFADLEALDYLAHAADEGAAPMLSAIAETLDAILAARDAAMKTPL